MISEWLNTDAYMMEEIQSQRYNFSVISSDVKK